MAASIVSPTTTATYWPAWWISVACTGTIVLAAPFGSPILGALRWVITAMTPGCFSAAFVSIDVIRPRAIVLSTATAWARSSTGHSAE